MDWCLREWLGVGNLSDNLALCLYAADIYGCCLVVMAEHHGFT